ncbi:MAG: chondroitin lyase, partial [Bacteroidetes bacterium]|nr:chondroitin lyase [Bacteroidota bacterium]
MINQKKRIFLLFILLSFFTGISSILAQSDLQKIKERVITELMKPSVDDTEVTNLLETIQPNGTWPGINYQDVSRTGFEHRYHLANMVKLARAYQFKKSKFYHKKNVRQTIELALKLWIDNDYFCDNWWHNQIGTPNGLVSLMLIIGDELDPELVKKAQPMIGRAHIDAPGARPGGDRIKIAGIQAKNLLFLDESAKFDTVIRVIEGEIKFSEWVGATYGYSFRNIPTGFSNREMGGRGIMHDYSFHHRVDGVNNTLSYGLGYADAFVEWAVYTADTQYAFSEEKLERLIDYFLDGICKTAVFGRFPDAGAKNRSISRKGTLKPYSAAMAEKLLETSNYRKEEIQEIIAIRNQGKKPTLSHATWYWHTEHFSFQRPDWFASVRMYSTRTHNMEEPYNSEGLLNHHRGDGANHISRTGDEYLDIWPVYDYQKIPGATIMQKPELPSHEEIQQLGLTDFVGAATDGQYGSVAFDFRSPHDPLIARKSWFFFDEEYVCLGAGISCNN